MKKYEIALVVGHLPDDSEIEDHFETLDDIGMCAIEGGNGDTIFYFAVDAESLAGATTSAKTGLEAVRPLKLCVLDGYELEDIELPDDTESGQAS